MSPITKKEALRQSNEHNTAACNLGEDDKRILHIASKHLLETPIDDEALDFGGVTVDVQSHHSASVLNNENPSVGIASSHE